MSRSPKRRRAGSRSSASHVQERRIDADLEGGRTAELVGELERLIAEHPLRERLRGQLMLALYRSGRQAEALAAYQAARSTLVEELGIEPGPALQELERAILRQDPSLDAGEQSRRRQSGRSSSQCARTRLDALLALAEPLARARPARELILARLDRPEELGAAAALLNDRRDALTGRGVTARAAAFTSADPGDDLVRLATEQDTDLLLLDCLATDGARCRSRRRPRPGALRRRRCSSARTGPFGSDRPVLVPFGGAEHDWAAVELAAWIARAVDAPLRLAGAEGDRAWASATRAGCSPAPRCSSSGPSAFRPSRCSCRAGRKAS